MIHINNKHNCCGCSACASVCPKHCITMQEDSEGFLYPIVDETLCIDCGLCERVCHELHPFDERKPQKVLAAINKDEEIRLKSSSGGIFYILAKQVIDDGGVVFGARFNDDWQVVIDYAEDIDGIKAFMGSKYVQARTETAYIDAKRFLSEGRKVLFSGTPCQIAGLHHFLRKQHDNLLTVDIICHGTPSPMVWGRYLDETVEQVKEICNIEFRNKTNGWKNFSFKIERNESDDTISVLSSFKDNPFMKAFLRDIILRPACYDCKAKSGRSHSDITIADFWGVHSIFPEMDDDKGTGLVFINSEKGESALSNQRIIIAETKYKLIKALNPACYRSPMVHRRRDEFFQRINNGECVANVVSDCAQPTHENFVLRCKRFILNKLRNVLGGGG